MKAEKVVTQESDNPNCHHPEFKAIEFARDDGGVALGCKLCGLRYYLKPPLAEKAEGGV